MPHGITVRGQYNKKIFFRKAFTTCENVLQLTFFLFRYYRVEKSIQSKILNSL
jgi:hypothetical protein